MAIKRIMTIRDRESRWLETALLERRILLLECFGRYVSHMTKNYILEVLNVKQNAVCYLCRSCKKAISGTYIQSSKADWLEVATA